MACPMTGGPSSARGRLRTIAIVLASCEQTGNWLLSDRVRFVVARAASSQTRHGRPGRSGVGLRWFVVSPGVEMQRGSRAPPPARCEHASGESPDRLLGLAGQGHAAICGSRSTAPACRVCLRVICRPSGQWLPVTVVAPCYYLDRGRWWRRSPGRPGGWLGCRAHPPRWTASSALQALQDPQEARAGQKR